MTLDFKQRRKELGLTLQEVADKVGVGASTVRKWENGMIDNIKQDKIPKLADALKVSIFDILDIEPDYNQSNIIPLSDFTTIPILGSIPCGSPKDREPENIGELMIEKKDVRGGEYFALYADGDSMYPTISNGETVVVRKQPTAENGELVAACVDGEITLKRLKIVGNEPILMPDNPSYEPISLNESPCTYIIGKVTRAINVRDF